MKIYMASLLSCKKISHVGVSLFSIWDKHSHFTKQTFLRWNVKLLKSNVGKYTRIKQNCSVSHASIGNFCGIGQNTQIGTGKHPTNLISTNLIFYQKNKIQNDWVRPIQYLEHLPITIGNDVWVGIGCLIMDGVTIGDGAIIGSKSVVTKDVPPYAIVVGVPARIVKYRFEPSVIDKLLKIQWWNFSDDEISEHIDLFTDSNISIDTLNKHFPEFK